MKVYIGWSKETSQKVASILKSCLPLMNPHIETFDSLNANPGEAWQETLSHVMSSCDCALFCVTEDNVNSPWLYYEAGFVSGQGKPVIPVLFDVSRMSFFKPLMYFQSLELTKDSMYTKKSIRALTHTLNSLCEKNGYAVSSQVLDATFEAVYPTIEKMLAEVRKSREEREREEYEREKRAWGESSRMDGENLQQDFRTLNSKLDAILSQLSKVSAGNVDGKAE